ncbi:hypothetical protein C8F04DRAFT_1260380 [Mycena alexandri]|uniref:Uncharacterized protein n=1 Tax=Mycena alexandri TaxID=1745969 RepID=A0AAD6SXG1_9AGAR|nr:hypothetical protein C8F04DRAFT_1260380 [Mycena alexandri]
MGLGARRTPYVHHLRLRFPEQRQGPRRGEHTPQRTHRPRVHRLRLEQYRSDILAGGLPALTPTREPCRPCTSTSSAAATYTRGRYAHRSARHVRTQRDTRHGIPSCPPRSSHTFLLAAGMHAPSNVKPRTLLVTSTRTASAYPAPASGDAPASTRTHSLSRVHPHLSPAGTHVPPARTQSGPKDVRSPRTRRPDSARRPRCTRTGTPVSCYDTTAHDVIQSNPPPPPAAREPLLIRHRHQRTYRPAHATTAPSAHRHVGTTSSVPAAGTSSLPAAATSDCLSGRIPPPHPHTRHDHLVIPTPPPPCANTDSAPRPRPCPRHHPQRTPPRLDSRAPAHSHSHPPHTSTVRIHHDIPAHPTAHPTRLEDGVQRQPQPTPHPYTSSAGTWPIPYRTPRPSSTLKTLAHPARHLDQRGLEYLRALAPRRLRTTRDPATISRPGADHSDPPALTRSQCCRQQMVRVESKRSKTSSSRSLDDSGGVHHLAAHADDDESVPEKSSAQRTRTLLLPCHTRGYALNATP